MSAITSLRSGIEDVTDEVEERVSGVLEATEGATLTFVSAVFVAVEVSVRQVVQIAFGLAETIVAEGFTVIDALVTAALGEVEYEVKSDDAILDVTGDVAIKEDN